MLSRRCADSKCAVASPCEAIAAPKMRDATDVLVESANKSRNAPLDSAAGNALAPVESPHPARPQKTSTADAESRWLPRKPAHIKGSKMKKQIRSRLGSTSLSSPPIAGP